MTTFKEIGLSDNLLETLDKKGYTEPTPIQEKIIPLILRGADVLACAPTGTGKTGAFCLPLIEILTSTPSKARLIRCLILVPTRELATQVCDSFRDYNKNHRLKVAQFIGGASIGQQKQTLNRGVDVAVATPGRFLDLYESGFILPTEIKNVVIDEADRMMDMGFMPDLRKILSALPKIRQTALLSATMPAAIKKLAQEFLMSPKEVMVEAPAFTGENIEQLFVSVPNCPSESERLRVKTEIMINILKENSLSSAIIFCNKKHHVDKVYKSMKALKYSVEVIHGDLTQSRRNRSIDSMKSGKAKFLVASDVAARGIDISNLPCVINMDIPMNIEDYVHRIGRTGRAGAKGRAFTMVTNATYRSSQDIMHMIGKQIDFLHDWNPDGGFKMNSSSSKKKPGFKRRASGSSSRGNPGNRSESRGRPERDSGKPSRGKPENRSESRGRPERDSGKPSRGKPENRSESRGRPERDSGKPSRGKPENRSESRGRPERDSGKPSRGKPENRSERGPKKPGGESPFNRRKK